jgi:hypothetical protein
MGTLDDATATQVRNIETKTGKSLAVLVELVKASGKERHGEIVAHLKGTLGLGHGDANLVAHLARRAGEAPAAGDPVDAWYAGPKAALRPIHDRVLAVVAGFGNDIEHAPKKTYVSLRRKKQFAMVGPAGKGTVEVGINLKGADGDARVEVLPPGGMCSHRTRLARPEDVDEHLAGWLRRAYDAAG